MPKFVNSAFFVASDGCLYDADKSFKTPIRRCYAYTFANIETTAQLLATLRNGQYTFPGCYPMFFLTADGATLSFKGVRENLRDVIRAIRDNDTRGGYRIVACDVNYEDGNLTCDLTNERIESAYADDADE